MTNPIETKPIDLEIWVAMNEDGGWVVVADEDDALTQLAENEGGNHARVVKLNVSMTPPKATEVAVAVPDEAGQTVAAEAVS